jgi:hypothetical protein
LRVSHIGLCYGRVWRNLLQEVASTRGTRGQDTMSTRAQHAATTPIPVQLSALEFHALIWPHLSRPKRGPQCQLGDHGVFTLLVWGLSTGMPWQGLPGPKDRHGHPALHDPTVDTVVAKWATEGSRWQACLASGAPLSEEKPLDLRGRHGDGPHPVAQTGGMAWATLATHSRRVSRFAP